MGSECQNLSFTSTKSCEVVGGAFIDHEEYTDTAVESIRNGVWLKAAVERRAESDTVAGSAGRSSIERVLSQVAVTVTDVPLEAGAEELRAGL